MMIGSLRVRAITRPNSIFHPHLLPSFLRLRIEELPSQAILMIMCSIGSLKGLAGLILASPASYAVFRTNRTKVLAAVLENAIDPNTLEEILAMDWFEGPLREFPGLESLAKVWASIEYFIHRYENAIRLIPGQSGWFADAPVINLLRRPFFSATERQRVQRAFVRLHLYNATQGAEAKAEFLSMFTLWELLEIWCVSDMIARQILLELSRKVNSREIFIYPAIGVKLNTLIPKDNIEVLAEMDMITVKRLLGGHGLKARQEAVATLKVPTSQQPVLRLYLDEQLKHFAYTQTNHSDNSLDEPLSPVKNNMLIDITRQVNLKAMLSDIGYIMWDPPRIERMLRMFGTDLLQKLRRQYYGYEGNMQVYRSRPASGVEDWEVNEEASKEIIPSRHGVLRQEVYPTFAPARPKRRWAMPQEHHYTV